MANLNGAPSAGRGVDGAPDAELDEELWEDELPPRLAARVSLNDQMWDDVGFDPKRLAAMVNHPDFPMALQAMREKYSDWGIRLPDEGRLPKDLSFDHWKSLG